MVSRTSLVLLSVDGPTPLDAVLPLITHAASQRRWVIEGTHPEPGGEARYATRRRAEGISAVVLAGTTKSEILLALVSALTASGIEVTVLSDAIQATSPARHGWLLKALAAQGAKVSRWGDRMLAEGDPVTLAELGGGDTTLWCGALTDVIDETTFDALASEVAWETMRHRGGEVPRRIAVQGALEADGVRPLYRHPADEQPAMRAWTPRVDAIRRAVEVKVGHPLNHGLLQLYRDGRDWISEHSDKTLDVVRPSSIINVSLGYLRTMQLRPKARDATAVERIPLPHGSFLQMGLGTNATHFHAIRQEGAQPGEGPRISLTFRCIGTLHDPSTGAVWGVGAPSKTREEATMRAKVVRGEAEIRDEAERMVRLFREENVDPSFDPTRYAPGFEVIDLAALNAAS